MKLLAFILFLFAATRAFAAFGYYTPFTVQSGQVPSAQTDFPMLINVTDARFKTTGNGGHVQNSNGYDIRPYSDSGLSSAMTYELERYNASTGEVVMWIKVSSINTGSVVYLAYGDSSLSTNGSSTSTWSNSFLGVYHVADGTTLNVNSSTGSNNGTNNGGTATTGKIDGGVNFVNTYIDLGTGMLPTATTFSAWVNASSLSSSRESVITRSDAGASILDLMRVTSTGKLDCVVDATGGRKSIGAAGSHTITTGTWFFLCLTYDSSAGLIGYVNAAVDGTATAGGNLLTTSATSRIGGEAAAVALWQGSIDEARVSSVARSANWITTEYNNQSAPGSFYSVGTEVSVGGSSDFTKFFFFFPR